MHWHQPWIPVHLLALNYSRFYESGYDQDYYQVGLLFVNRANLMPVCFSIFFTQCGKPGTYENGLNSWQAANCSAPIRLSLPDFCKIKLLLSIFNRFMHRADCAADKHNRFTTFASKLSISRPTSLKSFGATKLDRYHNI